MTDQPITIVRAQHGKDNPYFMMRRMTAQDKSLSWAARGMLAYLLSQPDDWVIKTKDLEQMCKREKVYSILDELEKTHYVSRQEVKDGKWTGGRWRYELYEVPQSEKPATGISDSIHNTEEEQKKDSAESVFTNVHTDSVATLQTPTSDVPQKTEAFTPDFYTSHGFKAGDEITQGDHSLGHLGETAQTSSAAQYGKGLFISVDGFTAVPDSSPATNDGASIETVELSAAATACLRYLSAGETLYADKLPDDAGEKYTYGGHDLPDEDILELLLAGYIEDADDWMYSGHDGGYRITAAGQKRVHVMPSVVEALTLRERAVRAIKGVPRSQAAVDMAIDEFNLQMNENPDDLVFREHLINRVLADPTEWVNHCSPSAVEQAPLQSGEGLFGVGHALPAPEVPLPPAPAGYDYLYSTGSEAVVHLVKKGKWQHGTPLCGCSVKFRTEKAEGLECLKRPVCVICLSFATAPKPEKKPRVKTPQPYDVLGNAIATNLFDAKDKAGVNAVWGRIGPILHGDKRSGKCDGLIAYEKERQGVETLDFEALAKEVPLFWKAYRVDNPDVKWLKDCAKVLDAWQAWRGNHSKATTSAVAESDYVVVEVKADYGDFWIRRSVHKDMLATLGEWRSVA